MTLTAQGLREELAETIAAAGGPHDPAWLDAVAAVPRDSFLGTAFFRPTGTAWEPVHRDGLAPEDWLRLVYRDATLVTQVDGIDAAHATGSVSGSPTSSSTLPSLVVRMLELAGITEGHKVLEVGTGTGYSTALLSRRLGDAQVYSVEYDPGIAALAAERLHGAGCHPRLIVGDGLAGHPAGAEYDRIVATCALRSVPPPLLWQLTDTGSLTFALGGWMHASGLVSLTSADDADEDTATGRFTGETVSYMLARPHRPPPRPKFFRHAGQTRQTAMDPALTQSWTGRFVAQLAAPSAEMTTTGDGVTLVDTATGSQAWTEPHGDGWRVHQHGPLHLWDQVETGITAWQQAGAPGQEEFGMTVTGDGIQTVWIGEPSGPSWMLPA
ncbi:ATP-grasp peptide maturase system methyltransferase [Streptomyces synnematoformans]|uniref:Protein-L-isoaspartate O-methyltransferase n=1 Tax=Streptomyces synnematoformans TaxID=415721 RepID=A0ABP5KVN5_9ACTN